MTEKGIVEMALKWNSTRYFKGAFPSRAFSPHLSSAPFRAFHLQVLKLVKTHVTPKAVTKDSNH